MIYFLFFCMFLGIVGGSVSILPYRDLGISVLGYTVSLGCAFFLVYRFEPEAPSTYILDPTLFSYIVLAIGAFSFTSLVILGFSISIREAHTNSELAKYREADNVRQVIRGTGP